MADPIDIVINDKISPAIESKLEGIVTKATKADGAVKRLQAAISALNIGGLDRITATNAKLNLMAQQQELSSVKLASANARLGLEQNRQAESAAKLALATARVTTEQQKQAAAASNAARANAKAGGAANAQVAAYENWQRSMESTARDAERLKRELFPLYDAQQRFNAAIERANSLLTAGAINEKTYAAAVLQAKNALLQTTQHVDSFTNAQNKMGKAAQINKAHLTNLGFQLNDIGVSLAGGQNPLLVLIQQGSQISGIASQAGVSLGRLGLAAARMLAPFLPLVVVIGAVVAGMKLISNQGEKNAGLEKYARDLGATGKEIRKLSLDQITFGDTMRGFFKTLNDATGISTVFSKIGGAIKSVFLGVLNIVGVAITSVVALFQAAYETVFKRANFVDSYTKNLAANQAKVLGFITQWEKNSADAAKKRIALALEDDKAAESRAASLRKINLELDNEIARQWMIGSARDKQAKLDQIQEQLVGKRIKLSQQERTEIERKVDALFAQAEAAKSYTASVESAIAPAQAYAAALTAQSLAGNASIVVQEALARSVYKTREAYADSLDPLRKFRQGIEDEISLASTRSDSREREALAQQERNRLDSEGVFVTDRMNEAIYKLIDARTEALIMQEREDKIYDVTIGKAVAYTRQLEMIAALKSRGKTGEAAQETIAANPEFDFTGTQTAIDAHIKQYEQMYARIKEMREAGVINAQTATALVIRTRAQEFESQTALASSFFGQMASLSSTGNKKLFHIAQAAALAQATIQGTVAIMNALSTPPWYVGALLAVGAAAQVYAQISQIKSQKAPGFATGGNMTVGGTGGTDSQMVNFRATPGEKIQIHTPAQAKALEKGKAVNVSIENYGTSKSFEVTEDGDRIRIIARDEAQKVVAERAPSVIAGEMANPNSRVSKSMNNNFSTTRKR